MRDIAFTILVVLSVALGWLMLIELFSNHR